MIDERQGTLLHGPRIGVTIGDPCGVGPALVVAARQRFGEKLRVFGDSRGFAAGKPDDRSARAQVQWLEEAAQAAVAGELDAIVTAPISKMWAQRAGFAFLGQTEFFASRLGVKEVAMMMAAPAIRVVLATTHLPLADVSRHLDRRTVAKTIRLTVDSLRRDFAIVAPRVAICGLNPHAGENGLLGREELDVIGPAIEEVGSLMGDLARLTGPIAADTAFAPIHQPGFDAIVAMYHDQGLAPIKAIDFDHTVNVTLGLPIVRTSPDHGVAYDLAGTGRARTTSFEAAIALAIDICRRRKLTTP